MKKIALLLSLILFTGIAACSKKDSSGNASTTKSEVTAVAQNEAPKKNYESLLTTEEVSKVCGIKDIKSAPKNVAQRHMGDLNFIGADNKELLILNIMPVSSSEKPRYKEEYKKHNYSEVNGYGDMAFVSNQKMMNISVSQFIFFKGDLSVIMTSSINPSNMKSYFNIDDLKKLSLIMISRM